MPTSERGEPKGAAFHLIFWLFAVMQQQVYWRIPQVVVDNNNRSSFFKKRKGGGDNNNVSVDLTQLAQVLDNIFASSSSSSSLSSTTMNTPRVTAQVHPSTIVARRVDVTIPEKSSVLRQQQVVPSLTHPTETTTTRQVTINTKSKEATAVSASTVMRTQATTNSSSSTTTTTTTEIITHRTVLEWPVLEEYAIEYPEFPLIDPNFLDPSHQRDFFQHRPPDE